MCAGFEAPLREAAVALLQITPKVALALPVHHSGSYRKGQGQCYEFRHIAGGLAPGASPRLKLELLSRCVHANRLRATPAMPSIPVASRATLEGSGVVFKGLRAPLDA